MLRDKLHELANKRQEILQMQEGRAKLQMDLEQSATFIELQKVDEVLRQLNQEASESETEVRKEAIAEWVRTSEKKFPGVTIGLYEVLTYDEDDALVFSILGGHALALSLKKESFKSLAKVVKPDFVQFSKEPRANIKKNLTEFL